MSLLLAIATQLALAEVPPASDAVPALEAPAEVQLTPEGDVYIRAPDHSLARIGHAAIVSFEAHCDAAACDLVLRTDTRRVAIGSHPRAAALPGPIFRRPVAPFDGRLGVAAPLRTGELTPDVRAPVQLERPKPAPPPVVSSAPPSVVSSDAPTEATAVASTGPIAPAKPIDPAGTVTLGVLEKSQIDDVIKSDMRAIEKCYRRRLAVDPSLHGKLTVKFVIQRDGTVSSAVVKSTTVPDPEVGTCVLEQFMGFVFPAPTGGGIVIVSYPFVFGRE